MREKLSDVTQQRQDVFVEDISELDIKMLQVSKSESAAR